MSRRNVMLVVGIPLGVVAAVGSWHLLGICLHSTDRYVSHSHMARLSSQDNKAIIETVRDWMSNYGTNRATVKATGRREPTSLPESIRSWQIESEGPFYYSLHLGSTQVTVKVSITNPDGSATDEILRLSLKPTRFGEKSWDSWQIHSVYMPSRP